MQNLPNPTLHDTSVFARRTGPRVPAGETLSARAISAEGPVVLALHDAGFRGFAIETDRCVKPETRTRFQFLRSGLPLFVADAVAIHCYRGPGPEDRWVSGWEFPEQPGLDAVMEELIEWATDPDRAG